MADVKRLYFKLREEVFGQQDMARRSLALDGFLQAHLGTQMKMSDIQHPRSVMTSFAGHPHHVYFCVYNACCNYMYMYMYMYVLLEVPMHMNCMQF